MDAVLSENRDRYVSYRRLEATGLSFALVADAVHSMTHGDPEVVSQSKADPGRRPYRMIAPRCRLRSYAHVIDGSYHEPRLTAQNFISREVGSIVPALVKDVSQAQDRAVRRPTGIAETWESRLPGLNQNVPAAIDVTGRAVQRPVSALGGINPFPFTTAANDPVVSELARLGISTPTPPQTIKLRGKPTQLTDAERQAIAQQRVQELYKRVSKLIQSGSWQCRTGDQKRKALVEFHRIQDEGRSARLTRLRRTYGDRTGAA